MATIRIDDDINAALKAKAGPRGATKLALSILRAGLDLPATADDAPPPPTPVGGRSVGKAASLPKPPKAPPAPTRRTAHRSAGHCSEHGKTVTVHTWGTVCNGCGRKIR